MESQRISKPTTSERCGECGHNELVGQYCAAIVRQGNVNKLCGCKCVFPATGAGGQQRWCAYGTHVFGEWQSAAFPWKFERTCRECGFVAKSGTENTTEFRPATPPANVAEGEPQTWCDHCSADLNGVKHILCERCYREFDRRIYTRETLRKAILNWLAHRCDRAPVCGNCTYCRIAGFIRDAELYEPSTTTAGEAAIEDFERAYFCAVRALRHLKEKNHDFIPLTCDGCKEVALFLTEPGYRGDEHNPIGADCERFY